MKFLGLMLVIVIAVTIATPCKDYCTRCVKYVITAEATLYPLTESDDGACHITLKQLFECYYCELSLWLSGRHIAESNKEFLFQSGTFHINVYQPFFERDLISLTSEVLSLVES